MRTVRPVRLLVCSWSVLRVSISSKLEVSYSDFRLDFGVACINRWEVLIELTQYPVYLHIGRYFLRFLAVSENASRDGVSFCLNVKVCSS